MVCGFVKELGKPRNGRLRRLTFVEKSDCVLATWLAVLRISQGMLTFLGSLFRCRPPLLISSYLFLLLTFRFFSFLNFLSLSLLTNPLSPLSRIPYSSFSIRFIPSVLTFTLNTAHSLPHSTRLLSQRPAARHQRSRLKRNDPVSAYHRFIASWIPLSLPASRFGCTSPPKSNQNSYPTTTRLNFHPTLVLIVQREICDNASY